MVDIFTQESIDPPKDIFASEGINLKAENTQTRLEDAPAEVQQEVDINRREYEQLAKSRFTDEQIAEIKAKGPIGFFEAKDFLSYEDVLPGGGVYQAADTFTLMNAAKKLEKGEKPSIYEDSILSDYIDKSVEMNLRGLSVPGGIAYYGSQVPAFMVEFAATAGVGKAAQKATQEAAEKAIGKVVRKKVATSAATKAVGVTANIAARTAAMPQRYTATFGELRLNDYMAVTDKGSVVFKESTESPAKSALKAFGYTSAEVASELSGAAIGKYVVGPAMKVGSRAIKTPVVSAASKLPEKLKVNLYKAYKAIKPNATVSKVFSVGGWNGVVEELGEERLADVLRASLDMSLDEDYTVEDYLDAITPSKDQLLIEAGIVSALGGIKTSATIAESLLAEKIGSTAQAKETVSNLTATEQETLVNDNVKVRPPEKEFSPVDDVVQGQFDFVEQQRAEEPEIDDTESGFKTFYREFVNSLQPIEDAVNDAQKKGAAIPAGENPFVLSRTYAGIIGTIDQNLRYGATRLNKETGAYEVVGKSLQNIINDFDNTVLPVEQKKETRHKDLEDYLIARRYLEDLQDRENVKVTEAQVQQSMQTMRELADKYSESFEWFDVYAQEIYEYQRTILAHLVDSGVMSQEKYDGILKENPNYIPFQRVLNEEQEFKDFVSSKGVFNDTNSNRIIKKIEGSDKDIKNTIMSVMKNTAQILSYSHRNRVALGVANLAEFLPENIKKVDPLMQPIKLTEQEAGQEKTVFRPSRKQPDDRIVVFRDGQKEYYEMSPALLDALKSMTPAQRTLMERVLGGLMSFSARTLRAGATLIPEFWVRNVIRDQATSLLQSPVRPTPIDTIKGLSAIIKQTTGSKSDLYSEWMLQGGSFNSYMELDDQGMQKAYKELFEPEGRIARYLKNPIRILEDITGSLEQATRIGVFSKAQKQGIIGMEAALLAREATLDFARGGKTSRQINRYVPFFNAGVQGVDKLIRTIRENPKATVAYGLGTITVPQLLITGYYLYGAPEDERKEYLEIPAWQKDLFFVFKTGDQWVRVPKPFSFGYIFGSVPERFMLWGYDGDKPEMKKFWQELVYGIGGAFSPVYDPSSLMPPLIKSVIEWQTNYNFFTQRDIYPSWMDNLPPEARANKFTSETAKMLGEQLKVSPAKIDSSLRTNIGGAASYITDAGDFIINSVREWNGEEIPEDPRDLSNIPLIRGFTVREPVGYKSNSVSNFFDNLEKVQQTRSQYRRLDGDKAKKYFDKNKDLIQAYERMNAFKKQIKKLGKMSDEIYSHKTMSPEEKTKKLSDLGEKMLDVAIEANKFFAKNVEQKK
jgi:hypothetical protein